MTSLRSHGIRAAEVLIASFFGILALGATAPFVPSVHADHPTVTVGDHSTGPINFFGSSPVPPGQSSFSFRYEHIDLDRYSDAVLEGFGAADNHAPSIDSTEIVHLSYAFGLTSDLTVGAHLPWIHRENVRAGRDDMGMVEVENDGSPEGIGDLRLFGVYRVLRDTSRSPEISVIGGVKLPTGETDERAPSGELIDIEHQPGSGSVDFSVGAAASKRLGRITIHASVLGTLTTEGDRDTELGDRLDWGVGISLPIARSLRTGPPHLAFDFTLELTGDVEGKTEINNSKDRNSGGNRSFLAPGVRVSVGPNVSIFGTVGFPVIDHPNGDDHETDLRVQFGVASTF